MSTLQSLQLPPQLAAFVEGRLQTGDYEDSDAYLRALIERDREFTRAEALRWIEAQVVPALESLDRGEGIRSTPEFWAEIRRDAERRGRGESGA